MGNGSYIEPEFIQMDKSEFGLKEKSLELNPQ